MANAHQVGYASGEAAVHARIGSSVVVNTAVNGDGSRKLYYNDDQHHDDDDARSTLDYDDDRAFAILNAERRRAIFGAPGRSGLNRVDYGVPVGLRSDDPHRDARADRAETLKPVSELLEPWRFDEADDRFDQGETG